MSQSIKQKLKPALLAALDEEIQAALDGARQAHETASHADNKPENQYDTLALEAAYLAHGQSERIRELQDVRIRINQWPVADFGADDLITSGALVLLEPAWLTCNWGAATVTPVTVLTNKAFMVLISIQ